MAIHIHLHSAHEQGGVKKERLSIPSHQSSACEWNHARPCHANLPSPTIHARTHTHLARKLLERVYEWGQTRQWWCIHVARIIITGILTHTALGAIVNTVADMTAVSLDGVVRAHAVPDTIGGEKLGQTRVMGYHDALVFHPRATWQPVAVCVRGCVGVRGWRGVVLGVRRDVL